MFTSKGVRAKPRAEIVACSFDVFDTFLLRACTTPTGVFERAFMLSRLATSHATSATSFVQHRIQAEAKARLAAKDASGSYEVGIEDIYARFPFRLFDLDRTALQDLAEAEYEAELDLCRANPEILRLYEKARSDGQRVGFISDTYWSTRQLGHLLRKCQPDLNWDFLYVSCENGTSKSENLFSRYLAEQRLDPATAMHVGDNENADIKGARRHGIRTRFYPQASASLTAQFERESTVFDLICGSASQLDAGWRTLRRMVAATTPEKDEAFNFGVATLGPVIAGFDAFIEKTAKNIKSRGQRTVLAFLGRDGFLPYRVWNEMKRDPAHYLEINRRVSLVASATSIEPIVDFLKEMQETKIDAETFRDMLKLLPSKVAAFFKQYPGGIATARDLAKALPTLIDENEIGDFAAAIRKSLLEYLSKQIPNFDQCTDLILVDLGYSGSVQKSLRMALDAENINVRIHGVYLVSMDDAYSDIAHDDTACGFVSDLIVTPHLKKMIARNVTVLEQICCSPLGSARDYSNGEVCREENPRTPEQIEKVGKIQSGALAYVSRAQELGPSYRLDPFASMDIAARWTAAILARALLLPNDDDLLLLGSMKHDVNLGTQTLVPLLNSKAINSIEIARGLPAACTAPAPPMWLAGSFAALSPSLGYQYFLFGVNRLPADVFKESKCGSVNIGLFHKDGKSSLEKVPVYRNGSGHLRIRFPVSQAMNLETIAVPIANVASEGILGGVVTQTGQTISKAMTSVEVKTLPSGKQQTVGLYRSGDYFRATDADGCLLIGPDLDGSPFVVITIGLTPLAPGQTTAESK